MARGPRKPRAKTVNAKPVDVEPSPLRPSQIDETNVLQALSDDRHKVRIEFKGTFEEKANKLCQMYQAVRKSGGVNVFFVRE